AKKALNTKSLYEFVKEMWDTFETAKFQDHWLIEYYCESYQFKARHFLPDWIKSDWKTEEQINQIKEYVKKKYPFHKLYVLSYDKQHLSINVPPRHTKSSTINVGGGTWIATVNPLEVCSVSHVQKLSNEMNIKRQKILNSDKYKKYFGEVTLVENRKDKMT